MLASADALMSHMIRLNIVAWLYLAVENTCEIVSTARMLALEPYEKKKLPQK